ncbi:hypothetical protein JX265_009691 [Neoarthrinium moseri]|uniref:6-phosphogluconate dehydrogenase NADP-binding domain-containing protein n=1 Tax=Neoarthrinium moseri TaxID=1658444 RepID=A0A9P9WFG6_9PEZI|nr:hypothetical protein JX266_009718 [Neoarthrinium moseri]KAI1861072.1 hypothetical protein JX265_009691 [Neoarthrinium moseri]
MCKSTVHLFSDGVFMLINLAVQVSNDAVLESTVDEAIASGNLAGKIYVDCSTVHPNTSIAVCRKITEAGAKFVAAPVFGASPVAEAGRLIFVSAGPESARMAIDPYLKGVMGRSIIDMGEDVSKSSLLKIAGNICTGLGPAILEQMLGDNFGPVIESYSKRLTTGAYAPAVDAKAGFDVALAIKDAKHAINCATEAGTDLEVSRVALKNMELACELQKGKPLDSSSMYGTIREDAGLDFYTDLCKKRDGVA